MRADHCNQEGLSVHRIQVVFKVVERCNINCTYCYYFNMGDSTALERPPMVSIDTASQIARWLAEGCRSLQTQKLSISFHGGEPMMLNPRTFASICSAFTDCLGEIVDLSFSIQTNGTILTDEWIAVFCRHRVHVGVSLDGNRLAHDRFRLDRKGRSTFDSTEKNLKTLVNLARDSNADIGPSTISVLDYRNDYDAIYKYLRGVGVCRMSFLLPDRNFDQRFSHSEESAHRYGDALFQIFKAWMTEDDSGVYIRFISEMLQHLQARKFEAADPPVDSAAANPSRTKKWGNQVLIIHSDGLVTISDSYIPALAWYHKTPGCSIHATSLADFMANSIFDDIEQATMSLSAKCRRCEWQRICRGGDLENRYSTKNGFDNPSVYCDGYLWFFKNARDLLVTNGYPDERIQQVLVQSEA